MVPINTPVVFCTLSLNAAAARGRRQPNHPVRAVCHCGGTHRTRQQIRTAVRTRVSQRGPGFGLGRSEDNLGHLPGLSGILGLSIPFVRQVGVRIPTGGHWQAGAPRQATQNLSPRRTRSYRRKRPIIISGSSGYRIPPEGTLWRIPGNCQFKRRVFG